MDFPILDNASLSVVGKATIAGLVWRKREIALVRPHLDRLRLKFRSLDQPVKTLSGGNQQKVVLSKWLATGPRVLIRHVWLGDPPRDAIAAKVGEYRTNSAGTGRTFAADEVIASVDAAEIAERVVAAMTDGDKTCVNIRVHVPGVEPLQAREQIAAVGTEVVPLIRKALVSESKGLSSGGG